MTRSHYRFHRGYYYSLPWLWLKRLVEVSRRYVNHSTLKPSIRADNYIEFQFEFWNSLNFIDDEKEKSNKGIILFNEIRRESRPEIRHRWINNFRIHTINRTKWHFKQIYAYILVSNTRFILCYSFGNSCGRRVFYVYV